uniref:EF-hand domain-containing protein n=1 Tax=Lates calcarifer TaxID=8187 RepID=A0A4W6FTC2_LATCA
MARMEQAIQNIVDMFVEYADGDGKLNKEELRKMMEKEIQNPEIKIMERMDRNRDGEVNFKEFVKCVVFMAKCLYRKKTGRCQEEED